MRAGKLHKCKPFSLYIWYVVVDVNMKTMSARPFEIASGLDFQGPSPIMLPSSIIMTRFKFLLELLPHVDWHLMLTQF